VDVLEIQNNYFQIVVIGFIISILARTISCAIHKRVFRISFSLLVWTLIYILLLFGFNYLLTLFNFNIWLNLFLIAMGLVIFTNLIKKISFKALSILSIILFILIFLVIPNVNLTEMNISTKLDSNISDVNNYENNNTVVSKTSNVMDDILTYLSIKSVNLLEIEKMILQYTNEERVKVGISALKLDSKLSDIARAHSEDMVTNDFFEHTNLIGDGPDERSEKAGYNIRKVLGSGTYQIGVGENIGMMATGNIVGVGYVSNDVDSIARAEVDSWMDSPGHRANILNLEYDVIGIGVAYDGSLYYFSTQDFK
jgi:uncharacterized protein YkwD